VHWSGVGPFEQSHAVAEKDWRDVHDELVEQAGLDALLHHTRAKDFQVPATWRLEASGDRGPDIAR
jgi:hypothetical protein